MKVISTPTLQEKLNRLSGLSPVLQYMRRRGLPLTPQTYRSLNYFGVKNPQPDETELEIIEFLTLLESDDNTRGSAR